MAKPLSDREVRQIVGMYLKGRGVNCIACRLGRSHTAVHNVLVRRGVELRQVRSEDSIYDPTPEEIRRETSRIKDEWSVEEERLRRGDCAPFEFPVITRNLRPA